MLIRDANRNDVPAISRCISDAVREHIAPTQSTNATAHLLSQMDENSIATYLAGDYQFFVAETESNIVGVSAVKLPSHLFYLFVLPGFDRRGIGTRLWNHTNAWMVLNCHCDQITVNASLNSVAIYQRLGFVAIGEVLEMHEVRFQPMVWTVAQNLLHPRLDRI